MKGLPKRMAYSRRAQMLSLQARNKQSKRLRSCARAALKRKVWKAEYNECPTAIASRQAAALLYDLMSLAVFAGHNVDGTIVF
eukprot:355337-Chlamydomonas_euryale.AAC.2